MTIFALKKASACSFKMAKKENHFEKQNCTNDCNRMLIKNHMKDSQRRKKLEIWPQKKKKRNKQTDGGKGEKNVHST